MTVTAAIFDIGGVLELVGPPDFMDEWRRRLGLDVADFEVAIATVDPDGSAVTGGLDERQMRRQYADALGLLPDQADRFMADMWVWYCGELDEALVDYVRRLRPHLKTGILSNSADGARREEERRYRFSELVDDVIYSHEVRLAKPDPAIFALACQRLDVRPQEIVFVDDVPDNVEAAVRFGMQAVLHERTADTIATIERLVSSGDK
ncbi:MAG TPA: HAD family phosphatase [Jatrophihabitantaceae bacterium]|nr:HAD family phosphatase [Jatrophihabitantaceae bacterium]